jgi:hypothetical protein
VGCPVRRDGGPTTGPFPSGHRSVPRLSGNRFGPARVANCAVIAPTTSQVTLNGDVWEATGLPVTIRKGA